MRGCSAAEAELEALPEVTVLRRTNAFGYLDHNYLVLHERVTDHLPLPPPNLPRQRLWRVRAKQVVLCHRRDRAAARLPRQRPARRHARQRRAHLPQPLRACARAHAPSSSPTTTAPTPRPSTSRGRAWRSRRSSTCGPTPTARCRRGRRGRAADPARRRRRRHRRPPPRVAGAWVSPLRADGSLRPRRAAGAALRLPPGLRRLEPDRPPVLAVARQAALRARDRGLRPGPLGPAGALGRRRQRQLRAGRLLRRGRPGRCRGGARAAGFPAAGAGRSGGARAGAGAAAADLGGAEPRRRRAGPRPSSTSRTTSPPRIWASPCARASSRSSTSSATPPPAWGPTRARPATSTPWRSWPASAASRSRPSAPPPSACPTRR